MNWPIRHAFQKPVVQIIDADQSIPFDVAGNRTIKFKYPSLGGAAKALEEIKQHIRAVEDNSGDADNPLTQAVDLQSLRQSGNPSEKSAAVMIAMLGDLKAGLNEVQQSLKKRETIYFEPSSLVSADPSDLGAKMRVLLKGIPTASDTLSTGKGKK